MIVYATSNADRFFPSHEQYCQLPSLTPEGIRQLLCLRTRFVQAVMPGIHKQWHDLSFLLLCSAAVLVPSLFVCYLMRTLLAPRLDAAFHDNRPAG